MYPNNEVGIIRPEAIGSFVHKKWDIIEYITRGRPQQEWVNTPWALDPWVIFHGAVNITRLTADWLNKGKDSDVTDEDLDTIQNELKNLNLQVLGIWNFILTNWHIARNKNKTKNLEPATSALMRGLAITCSQEQFDFILNKSSNYTKISYNTKTNTLTINWEIIDVSTLTPKHSEYLKLLATLWTIESNHIKKETDNTTKQVQNILK